MKGTNEEAEHSSSISHSCIPLFWSLGDRCSSPLALHPRSWTSHGYNGKFFILPGSSENVSLPRVPTSHIRAVVLGKVCGTVYLFSAVYFEYNINIFLLCSFFNSCCRNRLQPSLYGAEKSESPNLARI